MPNSFEGPLCVATAVSAAVEYHAETIEITVTCDAAKYAAAIRTGNMFFRGLFIPKGKLHDSGKKATSADSPRRVAIS
jgi:hypothetical protein